MEVRMKIETWDLNTKPEKLLEQKEVTLRCWEDFIYLLPQSIPFIARERAVYHIIHTRKFSLALDDPRASEGVAYVRYVLLVPQNEKPLVPMWREELTERTGF